MALILTPVPGNGVRVETTCCDSRLVVVGFPLALVKAATEAVESEHVCGDVA